jgi:hypothetical protein
MAAYRFHSSCVQWDREDLDTLHALIENAQDISRRTFLQHVDRGDLRNCEDELSYERHPRRGLTMAEDWHVSYHRSHCERFGRVYYFRHSAIEYVFVRPTR